MPRCYIMISWYVRWFIGMTIFACYMLCFYIFPILSPPLSLTLSLSLHLDKSTKIICIFCTNCHMVNGRFHNLVFEPTIWMRDVHDYSMPVTIPTTHGRWKRLNEWKMYIPYGLATHVRRHRHMHTRVFRSLRILRKT